MSAPTPEHLGGYRKAFQALRLGWRLFRDSRVPLWSKLIPLLAVLYIFSPFDLIPEIAFPVVGYLDDAALFFLSLFFFARLAPKPLVEEHLRAL
jgi:uncharacterized membrane protein YkvA (DUF1232 family)